MKSTLSAIRAGIARGGIELKHTFSSPQELWTYLFMPVALIVTVYFMRGATVPGTGFSLGARTLPSAVGMGIAFGGMVTMMMQLSVEREDGTLLRAKAIPRGMLGYLLGKIVLVSAMTLIGVLLQVPAMVMVGGLNLSSAGAWLTLAWVVLLGLIATMPLGAIFGSLISNPQNLGLVMFPVMGLVATSGIFYPITGFPAWLQWIAQLFPIYWLGLGMRSALLPGDLAAVEIGHSWRHLETVGVLGLWAALGLVLAPIVLRRMARRESGSAVDARRQKALQRVR
jgi:ABC-2 type transport system permease protein